MAVIAFDVALRVEPRFALRGSITAADLIAELKATTQRAAKIAGETTALLARIADLEAAVASGTSIDHAINAVSTQAARLRTLTTS